MTEIEQELKELKKQVKKLTNIVSRLTTKDYLDRFNEFEKIYYRDKSVSLKEISNIMGVSYSTIKRYKSQITQN